MFGQVQQNRRLCLLRSSLVLSVSTYFGNAVSLRILEQRELSEKLKPGRLLNRERAGGREGARLTAFFEAVKGIV